MTTNYEKIKNMSIEEMAEALFIIADVNCVNFDLVCKTCEYTSICNAETMSNVQLWLQQEVE